MASCEDCGRQLQGMDRRQLASGKCKWCFEQTDEGRHHYGAMEKEAERRLGQNWRSIVSGHGDQ